MSNESDVTQNQSDHIEAILKQYCPTMLAACRVQSDALVLEAALSCLRATNKVPLECVTARSALWELAKLHETESLFKAEQEFIVTREFILRARGMDDASKRVSDLMSRYCGNIMKELNDDVGDPMLREVAESSLSLNVLDKPGADLAFCITYIEENIDSITPRLRAAELHFLEIRDTIRKFTKKQEAEDRASSTEVIRNLKKGISNFNIIFVMILIAGLAAAAVYLSKDALALIAATIGAAISHLLAERNAIIGTDGKHQAVEGANK